MKTFTYSIDDELKKYIGDRILLDLETTGLSKSRDIVFLTGIMTKDGITQFYAETMEEEEEVIKHTLSMILEGKEIISFNGKSFDIPFLNKKATKFKLSQIEYSGHTDLYQVFNSLKLLLSLENCKLRTLMEYFDIPHEDELPSKEIAKLYFYLLKIDDEESLRKMLLHNKEDLLGTGKLLGYMYYLDFFKNPATFIKDIKAEVTEDLTITASLSVSFKRPVTFSDDSFGYEINGDKLRLTCFIKDGKGKLFYPDYKNYYYLTIEGYSIHKSLAIYTDKQVRQKALPEQAFSYFTPNEKILNDRKNLLTLCSNAVAYSYVIKK